MSIQCPTVCSQLYICLFLLFCVCVFKAVMLCTQEVEPTVGEALCRLFPPDENIDLRRIAQIARQSLKRRDPGGSSKISSSGPSTSRSASDLAPPGLSSEASSSRSDKLLLGLCADYGRTLSCVGRARRRRWTNVNAAAAGGSRPASCCRTQYRDILGFHICCEGSVAKTGLGRMCRNVSTTERDVDSKIRTFKWTLLLSPGAGRSCCCCVDCKRGGVVGTTELDNLGDIRHFLYRQVDFVAKSCRRQIVLLLHGL